MADLLTNYFGDPKEKRKLIIVYSLFILMMVLIYFFVPENVQDSGPVTLIPAIFLLVFIFSTKRIFEGLILGTVVAYFMLHKGDILYPFIESIQINLQSETYSWFLMVCGTLGGIIALLQYVGASDAFSAFVTKRVKSRKTVLLWTMLLGFIIFIDDYMSVLIRGTAMSKVTDKHKVSREFLAYVIDTSAAAVCIIIPFSTWAIFVSGLLEENGLAESGKGLALFIKTVPMNFYAICALVVLLLAIFNVIKPFGPMKAAERAAQDGSALPVMAGELDGSSGAALEAAEISNLAKDAEELAKVQTAKKPRLMNFLLPICVLIGVTIYFDIDAVAGIFTCVVFMFIFYIVQKIITPEQFAEVFVEGVKDMVFVLLLMLFSLTFATGIEAVGCMDYMINIGVSYGQAATFPVIIFIIFAVTEFVMGLVWSLYIIAFPIVIPIAIAIGADPILTVAAVCSAGVWGSNTCFYVDATILSAQAAGITPFRHGITQLPYALLAGGCAAVLFLIFGFIR